MDNQEFWTSISTIILNGFDSEGKLKLEQYAKQFITGQLLFKRYTEDEQFGCAVEVLSISLHPYSREQKLQQIESLHRNSVSKKEYSNCK